MYRGNDDNADATAAPTPQPPSFVLKLPAAPTVNLQTLNSDELERLRPGLGPTPIGVHRTLPSELVHSVPDHDALLPVLPPRAGPTSATSSQNNNGGAAQGNGLLRRDASQPNAGGTQNNGGGAREALTHTVVEKAWQWIGNGRLWRVQIQSPGASGLRVHFQNFNVGAGRVWLHTSEGQVYGPYTGQGMYGDGDFWSDIVFGPSFTLEYQPGPDDPITVEQGPVPFRIHKISHLTDLNLGSSTNSKKSNVGGLLGHVARNFSGGDEELSARNVGYCRVDVNCDPRWRDETNGVALVTYASNGADAWCSGTLLNNRRQDYTPYFVTAAHCISTNSEARSMTAWWRYESAYCGGPAPSLSSLQRTIGARLLKVVGATNRLRNGDISLLQLNAAPPTGSYFQGWSPTLQLLGSNVVGIHHPDGSFKRISYGVLALPELIYLAGPFYGVAWTRGIVEQGSSGSPLFNNAGQVIGVVSGGSATLQRCIIGQKQKDNYSRFSDFYPQIRQWLDPTTPPATTPKINSFTATPSTINRGGSTTLRWSSSNASRATISGIGSVSTSGSRVVRPTSTTTYRLTITSANNRTTSKNLTVTVRTPGTAPRINSFTATPSTINRGGSATLRWSSSNARRASISGVGSVSTSGSRVVRPTSTTTYRLTITSANNRTTSKNVTVTVRTPGTAPRINSFTATPSTINRGGSTTLRWSSSNASRATIAWPGGSSNVSTSGSKIVRPTSTRTYGLTVTNSNGRTTTRTITIVVRAPTSAPRINSFTATHSTINRGGSATLRWSSSNANRATIAWPGGSSNVSVAGTKIVTPTSTTTYYLTVTSANGQSITRRRTVTVHEPDSSRTTVQPKINSFTASSLTIARGNSVTLQWSSSNSSSATISGIGSVPTSGSRIVRPTNTTTYRLVVTSSSGHKAEWILTVRVRDPEAEPRINSFTASSTSITRGSSTTLRWSSSNASRATISWPGGSSNVSVAGTKSVSPTSTTTYRLTVTNTSGQSTSRTISISVRAPTPAPAPTINSFTASPSTINAGESTTLKWSTSNADRATISWPGGHSKEHYETLGSKTVSPTQTTTYRLTITDVNGRTTTSSVTIVVRTPRPAALPKITLFITSYSSIDRGGSTSLRWASSNASRARLSWPGGSLNVSTAGTRTVSPTSTTTYRLTVTSASGQSATDTVTVRVRVSAPKITSFTASPSTIDRGGSTTLRWTSEHATRAIILLPDGSRDVSASGALTVRPNRTTTYHITVSNADGQITTKFFTVIVREPALPIITSFSVSAASIASGENVVLRWTTSNAQTVNLDCGNAPIGGITFTNRRASRASYTLRGITSTAVCFLTATSAHGDRVSSSQVITVLEP